MFYRDDFRLILKAWYGSFLEANAIRNGCPDRSRANSRPGSVLAVKPVIPVFYIESGSGEATLVSTGRDLRLKSDKPPRRASKLSGISQERESRE